LQKYLEVEKGFSNEQSAKQLAYQRAKLEVLEKNYEIYIGEKRKYDGVFFS